jgi:hypothetical protein
MSQEMVLLAVTTVGTSGPTQGVKPLAFVDGVLRAFVVFLSPGIVPQTMQRPLPSKFLHRAAITGGMGHALSRASGGSPATPQGSSPYSQ